MSYSNIGMRSDYMNSFPRGSTQSVYSPLQTVSGLQSSGQSPQEPSTLQEVVGGLSMANTANSAVKGLTGFDPAKEALSGIKDYLASNPSAANSFASSNWINDLPTGDMAQSLGNQSIDWIANTPGNEAVDYLGSLGMDGLGQGIDLSSVGSGLGNTTSSIFGDMGSFSGVPVLSIASNLADGHWGWSDTGSTVGGMIGSAFGPIGTIVGSTIGNAIGEPVGDIVEGVGSAIGDVVSGIGDIFGGGGGGCFLTTACARVHGNDFSDDCRELTALRQVRDEYIRNVPGGSELIEEYYRTAPIQVEKLRARDDADQVFSKMYHEYIVPAVEAHESGNNQKALNIYLDLVDWVKQETEE